MEQTPFNMVFNALWGMAEDSPTLTELVKVGNRIKFNQETNRDPIKENVQAADLPELTLLVLGGSEVNLHSSSCGSVITRDYSWVMSTGDLRYTHFLGPVEWALWCAMANWQTALSALTWNEKPFVINANITNVTSGFTTVENNRGIKGWSSIWGCSVGMTFTTADLKAFSQGSL